MSDSDAVSSFSSLDELIQVMYQGSSRFVVISLMDETSWKVRLGLSDSDGRWWEGRWAEKEIRQAAKAASSSAERLGDALAAAFAQGEMYVGNWSSRKGAEINFVLGTNTNHPAHVPLVELSAEEAASFATQVFADIAIQAQNRKSRLHPSPFESVPGNTPSAANTSTTRAQVSKPSNHSAGPGTSERKAQEEIKALKAELARERSRRSSPPPSSSSKHKRKAEDDTDRSTNREWERWTGRSQPLQKERSVQESSKLYSIAKGSRSAAPPTAGRGASLANPTKKARKYQALEFGSDED